MVKQSIIVFFVAVCMFTLVLLPLAGAAERVDVAPPTDISLSFIVDGLGFDSSTVTGGIQGSSLGLNNDHMNHTGYQVKTDTGNIDIGIKSSTLYQGLWFVTFTVQQSSEELPVCMHLSTKIADRARDFLTRYRDWTANTTLDEVITMLDMVNFSSNSTIIMNQWNMTIDSSPHATSIYWMYTQNGSSYRGLGITFVEKYVFFRDDRTLHLGPQEAPLTVFTTWSPYIGPATNELILDFPLNGNFSLMTPRPASIVELYLDPPAKIAPVIKEVRFYSGYFTFILEEPLQPFTTYVATRIVGQGIPGDFDSAPVRIDSWMFTTGNSTVTPEPAQTQAAESSNSTLSPISSVEFIPASFSSQAFLIGVALIIVVLAVAIVIVIRKKNQAAKII